MTHLYPEVPWQILTKYFRSIRFILISSKFKYDSITLFIIYLSEFHDNLLKFIFLIIKGFIIKYALDMLFN